MSQPIQIVRAKVRNGSYTFQFCVPALYVAWDEVGGILTLFMEPLLKKDENGKPDDGTRVFDDVLELDVFSANSGYTLIEYRRKIELLA